MIPAISSLLKIIYMVPPAAALVFMGAWNLLQVRSIATVESERRILEKRIAAALARRTVDAGSRANGPQFHPFSRHPVAMRDSSPEMTAEELIAALDEMDGRELSAAERDRLEAILVGKLIDQDPRLALERFADRISSPSGVGWQLTAAFEKWAMGDLAAATAWLDRQIAEGKLDSTSLEDRNEMRLRFEGALLASLLAEDPDAAARRLADLPADLRREVLQQLPFSELSAVEQTAYTRLVRGLVPPSEREGSFAHAASELAQAGDLSDVRQFLDSVNASPQERAAAARHAADSHLRILAADGPVTATEVDAMRQWLEREAPALTDSITGKALAEAAQQRGKLTFQDAASLVLHYQASSGNDAVLVAFLRGYAARSNLDEAKHLVDRIKDAKLRAEILTLVK
jgi:hypothetical protein